VSLRGALKGGRTLKIFGLIVNRLVYAFVLLFAVLVLNFTLMHLAPGDVADTISQSMGGADEELLIEIRKDYGLDQPYYQQLATYIGKVLRFDLGHSFFFNEPVSKLVLERVPATLLLVITAQILALLLGVVLGVYSARKPNGIMSHFVTFFCAIWLLSTCVLDGNTAVNSVFSANTTLPSCWNEGCNYRGKFLGTCNRCNETHGTTSCDFSINFSCIIFSSRASNDDRNAWNGFCSNCASERIT